MANAAHLNLLQSGVDKWNFTRTQKPGTIPDLSGADLSKMKLDGANLSKVNLEGITATGATFVKANMESAKMTKCLLESAVLRTADLR
ncbi:MAG: pentapeptide repeat-containing protein, partial [Bryobacterales bacterium]|nr:pentapeptide repeat-containing protein [Bryobacterales bacterium]